MDNDKITLQKIDGIYDIHPPVEPPLNVLEISLLSISTAVIISFILYIIWGSFFSKKAIARRKLKALYKQYSASEISSHDAVYQLCHFTKIGLKTNKLNKNTVLPAKLHPKKEQWEIFIEDLTKYRYKKCPPLKNNFEKLYLDCLFWLKVWP